MSRDGYLPPGVSHEDVERAAGAWEDEEVRYCACPCQCSAVVEDEDTRCAMCEEGCGPMGPVTSVPHGTEAALRESIAKGLEKVGCAGCSVLRPFRSHRSPAGPGEHEPECPVALAERVRAGEWG